MKEYYWDNKIEYLSQTRGLYYNDDYIEFLVKSVWKIDSPVSIVDFGCGYGFLASKLLPLLPNGSKYTGIDAGEELLHRAKEIYKDSTYDTEFIQGDIQQMNFEKKYDISICHAFLLHMPNPIDILKKMIDSVVDNGRIICFEPHWISNMSSYHFNDSEQSSIIKLGLLQEHFERNAKREGKDGNIGMKLPIYLNQLGVRDIECRVSDKVNFLNHIISQEKKEMLFNSLREEGIGNDPGDRESMLQRLIDSGATIEEAHKQYEAEKLFADIFNVNSSLTYAPSMKITFGKVSR